MKKRVSLFMVIVMLFGMLPNTILFGAPTQLQQKINFVKYNKSLDKVGQEQGLTERTPTEEETSLQWDMAEVGTYSLSYYVQDGVATSHVKLDFDVKSTKEILLKTSVETKSLTTGPAFGIIYKHMYPYTGGYTPVANGKFNLKLNSQITEDNELSIKDDKNLEVRLKIQGTKIILTTNNVEKGNLTEFNLKYNNTEDIGTINDFKGFETFEIVPTHLMTTGGNLISDTDIIYPGEKPGSKPGILVKIKRPRQIDSASGLFKYMDDTAAAGANISLVLWPQFTAKASSTDSVQSTNLHLQFNLGKDADVKKANVLTGITTIKPDKDNNNVVIDEMIGVYISKNAISGQQVIGWDKLNESMLVGGNAVISFNNKPLATPSIISPEQIGHTYLEFSPTKTGEQEIELEIEPYNIDVPVIYEVFENRGNAGWIPVQQYIAPKSPKSNIYITLTKAVDQQYKIIASLDTKTKFESQALFFNPENIEERPPVSPIVKADNIYVVPGDPIANSPSKPQPEAIGFDIEWLAPKISEITAKLNKGDLYYELLLRSTNDVSEVPKLIKVFKIEKTTDSIIRVMPYAGEAGGALGEGVHYTADGTFKMSKVALKNADPINPNELSWGWEWIDMPDKYLKEDSTNKEYPKESTTKSNSGNLFQVKNNLGNTVPGTYYLSMRTVFDNNKIVTPLLAGDESNLVAISLDEINQVVPTPDTIKSEKSSAIQDKIAQYITFSGVDITKYVDNMLEPAKWHLYPKASTNTTDIYQGNYEIFVYQENANSGIKNKFVKSDFDAATSSQIYKLIDTDKVITLDGIDLNTLRNGGIIPIKLKEPESSMRGSKAYDFTLANLDPNQVYCIQIRVRLDAWKAGKTDRVETSILSKILTFTTQTKPVPPTPDDQVPPAPQSFSIKEQPNNTSVVLEWEKAKFAEKEDEKNAYYEIIRTTDKELAKEQLSSKKSIEDLVNAGEDSYPLMGYRTMAEDIYIKTYSKLTKLWTEALPQQSVTIPELKDISLAPNTIYYYYIRTVSKIDGSLVRSQWIMIPVTTNPIAPPKQLKVETPKAYSYNPKTETVISFLAPIPRDAIVPTQYDFDIAVKSELDEDYKLDYKWVKLVSSEKQELMPDGYTHYVYKITGLKPGKRYDIKVRLIDKTKPVLTGGDYPKSLYCDKVVARTEFDEADQEKDDKFAEYLKKYDDAVEKLRRAPHWQLKGDNKYSLAYKYREAYVNAEMAVQNTYELQTGDNATKLTYYLPANMLDKASDLNVGINAVLGNTSMSLRPYTLTADNEKIKEVISNLNANKIKGYYIKLDFYTMSSSGRINGEDAISPEICVDIEIVSMEEEDLIIEDDIMIALNKLIDKERKDIITLLEKELDKGTINEEKLKDIIDDAVQDIKKGHQDDAKDILKRETDKTSAINEIEKPILITSVLDSYSVNGYYLEGSWNSVEVIQANGGFAIEALKLGIYAFTGKTGIGNALPEVAMHQDIISKYNLTDFFTLDAYMIKTGATKKQVYGVLARILGAKRNTDYSVYLKNRGIKGITSIGIDKTIRQDEAVYLVMQAYEKIYNKPISSINIKNRQGITNIGAFQMQYRPYIYAAVELKVIKNPNAKVLPSKAVSVEEMINMLSNIVAR